MRKLRFANINPREKSTDSQFAKLNPRGMLKKMNCELFSLRYSKINFQKNTYATLALKFQANIGRPVNAKQSRLQANKKIYFIHLKCNLNIGKYRAVTSRDIFAKHLVITYKWQLFFLRTYILQCFQGSVMVGWILDLINLIKIHFQ